LWVLIAPGLLFFSVSPAAKAEISNCNNIYSDVFFPGEIAVPVDFDAVPNGSIVAKTYGNTKTFECSVGPNDVVGFKINVIPGIKQVNQVHNMFYHHRTGQGGISPEFINAYTVPELESRGLGFFISYRSLRYSIGLLCGSMEGGPTLTHEYSLMELPLTEQSVVWTEGAAKAFCGNNYFTGNLRVYIQNQIYIVKIGNPSQHTTLPQNFTVTLFSISLYTQSAPTIPAATFGNTWYISNFAANVRVRTCATPTASESFIDLGHYQQGNIQSKAAGTVLAQREFTFTFVCPRKRYDSISFLVEPMYGIEPAYPGTMNIASGTGMAQGVGVQLFVRAPPDSYQWPHAVFIPVIYRTDPLSNAGSHLPSISGKYPLFQSINSENTILGDQTYSLTDDDPPTIQRVVNFRANLIRLPGPLQPGQIKAAALIHIRYN